MYICKPGSLGDYQVDGPLVDMDQLQRVVQHLPVDAACAACLRDLAPEDPDTLLRVLLLCPSRSLQHLLGAASVSIPDHLSAHQFLYHVVAARGADQGPCVGGSTLQEMIYIHLCYLAGLPTAGPRMVTSGAVIHQARGVLMACRGSAYLRCLRYIPVEQAQPVPMDPTAAPQPSVEWVPYTGAPEQCSAVLAVEDYDPELDVLVGAVHMSFASGNLAAILSGAMDCGAAAFYRWQNSWVRMSEVTYVSRERQLFVQQCLQSIQQRSAARNPRAVDTHGHIQTVLTAEQAASIADMHAIQQKDFCEFIYLKFPRPGNEMLVAEYPKAGRQPNDPLRRPMYRHMPIGLLASPPGSGKTLVTLAYIFARGLRAIIVVPATLAVQWLRECERHIAGFAQLRASGAVCMRSPRSKFGQIGAHTRLAIVASSSVKAANLGRMGPHALFVDEAHELNWTTGVGHQVQCILDTQEVWAITGTPAGGYANVLALLRLHELSHATGIAHHEQDVAMAMSNHFTVAYKLPAPTFRVESETREVVSDAEGAFWNGVHRLMVDVRCHHVDTRRADRILKTLMRCTFSSIIDTEATLGHIGRLLGVAAAAQAGGGGAFVFENTVAPDVAVGCSANDECAVCMMVFQDPYQLACNHVLCRECMVSVMGMQPARCPYCRTPAGAQAFRARWSAEDDAAPEVQAPRQSTAFVGKARELARLLRAELTAGRPVRAVVFVCSTHSKALCLHVLQKLGLEHRLAGFTSKTDVMGIEEFRARPEVQVLLAHQRVGVGHDLNDTSLVCIMDVTPDVAGAMQAMGRVMRMSQTNQQVRIVKLVTRGGLDQVLDRMIEAELPVGFNKATLELFAALARPMTGLDELVDRALAYGLAARCMQIKYPRIVLQGKYKIDLRRFGYDEPSNSDARALLLSL